MILTYEEDLPDSMDADPCYRAIKAVYGDKTTARSGVRLMRHIDEGLVVLRTLHEENRGDISLPVLQAYCLHPIFQDDQSLLTSWRLYPSALLKDISVDAVILAMEYRGIANAYLSEAEGRNIAYEYLGADSIEIKLSPLSEVQSMLVADKVQNRKDFDKYFKGKHKKSNILEKYFDNWFKKLGITKEWYGKMIEKLEKI